MKHLLSSSAFLVVNKKLSKEIGLLAVVLLADLISKESYFLENQKLDNGWFFNTAKNIQEDTTLTSHQQRRCIKILKKLGIIETKVVGIPAKQHFKIIETKLLSYLNSSYNNSLQLDVKKTQTDNKNNKIKITNNISNNMIKFRKMKFGTEVSQLSAELQMSVDMANEFLEYWCEANKSKTKMRWELEKTFDISLRLKRWLKNQKNWNKGFNGKEKEKYKSKIDMHLQSQKKAEELLEKYHNDKGIK